jgi:hypothetical protein
MKIFLIVTEHDGQTTAYPNTGERSTEIKKMHRRFAANNIEQVIKIMYDYISPDEDIVAILEEHPSIIILKDDV